MTCEPVLTPLLAGDDTLSILSLQRPLPAKSLVPGNTVDAVMNAITHIPVKVKVKIAQSCPTLCYPWTIWSLEFSRPEYWSGKPFHSPGDLPNPGIEPRSPALQADSLLSEKPKKTGVGSLSLLQQIFPTQESNWSLLHCRQILYQLSYQKSPKEGKRGFKKYLRICYTHGALG